MYQKGRVTIAAAALALGLAGCNEVTTKLADLDPIGYDLNVARDLCAQAENAHYQTFTAACERKTNRTIHNGELEDLLKIIDADLEKKSCTRENRWSCDACPQHGPNNSVYCASKPWF